MENQTAYYPPVQPAGILQTKPQTDIAARIKCKESRFGKTLMWVYIVYIAIRYIAYAAAIGFLLYIIGKMAI